MSPTVLNLFARVASYKVFTSVCTIKLYLLPSQSISHSECNTSVHNFVVWAPKSYERETERQTERQTERLLAWGVGRTLRKGWLTWGEIFRRHYGWGSGRRGGLVATRGPWQPVLGMTGSTSFLFWILFSLYYFFLFSYLFSRSFFFWWKGLQPPQPPPLFYAPAACHSSFV